MATPNLQYKDGYIPAQQLWAKLTAFTTPYYAWTEQQLTAAGWIDKPGGAFGTVSSNPAWDANGVVIDTSVTPVVLLYRGYFDTTVDWVWVIAATDATGGGAANIIAHTSATFTVPAVDATTSVQITPVVDTDVWMVVGQTILVTDGVHIIYGHVTTVTSLTAFTIYVDRIANGNVGDTMAVGAEVIISGDYLFIRSINDNYNKRQTIGITDDIVLYPDSLGGLTENEMAVAPSIQTWVTDRLYMTGWLVGWAGRIWRATRANTESMPDDGNDDWVDVTDQNITLFHLPKGRIYTPDAKYAIAGVNYDTDPREVPAGQNFKFKQVGSIVITADSVTDEVTFNVPDGSIVIINETNIYNYDYSVNTLYFNTFNQTITIKYGDTIYNFYSDCCEGRKWYCMTADAQSACYNLTAGEYATMLIEGYTKTSGPHDTKVECEDSCGGVPTEWWCLEEDGVSACLELTQAELFLLIDTDGFIPQSGPHLNQVTCIADCDIPAPITTACCVETIPQTLIGTVTAKTGGCVCMPDRMIFTYQGGDRWTGSTITTCTNNGFLHLDCTGGVWTLGNASVGTSTLTSLDCDPLQIVFAVTGDASTCTGTYTVTITI